MSKEQKYQAELAAAAARATLAAMLTRDVNELPDCVFGFDYPLDAKAADNRCRCKWCNKTVKVELWETHRVPDGDCEKTRRRMGLVSLSQFTATSTLPTKADIIRKRAVTASSGGNGDGAIGENSDRKREAGPAVDATAASGGGVLFCTHQIVSMDVSVPIASAQGDAKNKHPVAKVSCLTERVNDSKELYIKRLENGCSLRIRPSVKPPLSKESLLLIDDVWRARDEAGSNMPYVSVEVHDAYVSLPPSQRYPVALAVEITRTDHVTRQKQVRESLTIADYASMRLTARLLHHVLLQTYDLFFPDETRLGFGEYDWDAPVRFREILGNLVSILDFTAVVMAEAPERYPKIKPDSNGYCLFSKVKSSHLPAELNSLFRAVHETADFAQPDKKTNDLFNVWNVIKHYASVRISIGLFRPAGRPAPTPNQSATLDQQDRAILYAPSLFGSVPILGVLAPFYNAVVNWLEAIIAREGPINRTGELSQHFTPLLLQTRATATAATGVDFKSNDALAGAGSGDVKINKPAVSASVTSVNSVNKATGTDAKEGDGKAGGKNECKRRERHCENEKIYVRSHPWSVPLSRIRDLLSFMSDDVGRKLASYLEFTAALTRSVPKDTYHVYPAPSIESDMTMLLAILGDLQQIYLRHYNDKLMDQLMIDHADAFAWLKAHPFVRQFWERDTADNKLKEKAVAWNDTKTVSQIFRCIRNADSHFHVRYSNVTAADYFAQCNEKLPDELKTVAGFDKPDNYRIFFFDKKNTNDVVFQRVVVTQFAELRYVLHLFLVKVLLNANPLKDIFGNPKEHAT